jgi:hypothetical protein
MKLEQHKEKELKEAMAQDMRGRELVDHRDE